MSIPFGRRTLCPLLLAAWIGASPAQASPDAPATRVERVAVESSSLLTIGFARETRVLEIEFRSGATYRYLGVAPAVFEELKKAESKGRYFAQFIRGKYDFQRIRGPAK